MKKSTFLLSTAALLTLCINISATSVDAKGRAVRRGAYLVPPPPAYAPSILPTLARAQGTTGYSREVVAEATEATEATEAVEAKPVHIKVYGQTAIIKPVASRGGVSTYR